MMRRSEKYRNILEDLNRKLWTYAEVKFQEKQSVKAMLSVLEQAGYQVKCGVAGIETAFIASLGDGKPVIGLLAEYDALDGLSQKADILTNEPRAETTHGHGCGHNLLGTGIIGAALLLKDSYEKNEIKGTVRIYGCPAEEGGSGKVYMMRDGLFQDVDIALTWHPSTMNGVMTGSMLANIQAYFRFSGIAAHAAAAPHLGRSALDAVEIMDVGVNYMREHMEMTDRVHYAITNSGGKSPNVVQSTAEVLYLIRSRTVESAKRLYERVCNIARGAAMITETDVEIVFDKACSEVVPNHTLAKTFHDSMTELGLPQRDIADIEYVRSFSNTMPKSIVLDDIGQMPADYIPEIRRHLISEHLDGNFILPYVEQENLVSASSDMGDVSCIVPLVQLQTACFALGTQPHSWQWVSQGTSRFAIDGMLYASDILADVAEKLFSHPELIEKAQAELKERTGGKKYNCPIPENVFPRV